MKNKTNQTYADKNKFYKDQAKIAILTTDTVHHKYFVEYLAKRYNVVQLILESRQISLNYEIHSVLDEKENAYENSLWFENRDVKIEDLAPCLTTNSTNNPLSIEALRKASPDIIIAFGVGKLDNALLSIAPERVLVIQATDSECYTGLDTLYWAAFHQDFSHMAACVNLVEVSRQQADKILKYYYTPSIDVDIYQLRSIFTLRAIDAIQDCIAMYHHFGQFISQPKNYEGRFYYFMPSALKDLLDIKFKQLLTKYWEKMDKK